MKEYFSLPEIDRIASAVRQRLHVQPKIAIVLGSGLGELADFVQDPSSFLIKKFPIGQSRLSWATRAELCLACSKAGR